MSTLSRRSGGFTLIELLVAISIILVTAGIVYAAMGPSREKARQAVCMSNLRQIGLAVRMYCSDEGGEEVAGGAHTADELGLPRSLERLHPYLKSRQILHCPDENWAAILGPVTGSGRFVSSYMWTPAGGEDDPPLPFSEMLRRRGAELPIAICLHHDFDRKKLDAPTVAILLRASGAVTLVTVPQRLAGWEY